MKIKTLTILLGFTLLCGCGSVVQTRDGAPRRNIDVSKIPNAVPKAEPRSRYGNPDSYVVFGKRYYTLKSSKGYDKRGIASWYGTKFHNRLTSSREPYNMYAMTAASKTLPLPTYVQVTNLENNRKVIVKVNDRGPFEKGRILDLSYAAAKKLDMLKKGTALVEVKAINPATWNRTEEKLLDRETPILENPGHPELFLQVAALSNKAHAKDLEARLQALTHQPTRLEPVQVNERTTYRVQIGPLASVNTSDAVTQELIQAGYGEPRTVIQ